MVILFIVYFGLGYMGIEFRGVSGGIIGLRFNRAAYIGEMNGGGVSCVGSGEVEGGK